MTAIYVSTPLDFSVFPSLLLVATLRMHRGATRGPLPDRDRFLSPYSPYRWQQESLPRSPGTVPGADPFPSVPQGAEDDDAQ